MTSNVWFTSDAHFGHRLVSGLRGFDSAADHDAALIETFNSLVKPKDQVWWLGDMSAGDPAPVFAAMPQIPGAHHLVTGNHYRCSPIFRDSHRWQRRFMEHFESVQAYARRRVVQEVVHLSHYPYATEDGQADRGEVRYAQHRLPDLGDWLLHGHTHMADQKVHVKQIHVGLDAWDYRPVNLDEIVDIVQSAS